MCALGFRFSNFFYEFSFRKLVLIILCCKSETKSCISVYLQAEIKAHSFEILYRDDKEDFSESH